MRRRQTPRTLAATAATTAVLAAVVLTLTGCGGSEPEASGSANLAPADAPDGWTAREQGAIQVSAPEDWAEFEPEAAEDAESTGATSYGLKAPVAADGSGTGVFTIIATEPANDAAKATSVARGVGESTLGATDVVEEELEWPGAEAAAYLSYEAELPMPSGDDVVFRYEFLILDLADGSQAIVNVVGPAAGYDEAGVHDVLASTTAS
ncbi:hypothetical protein [Pengzhenrongella sicca]|uniref:Uncharacterized protein n=1 Tax=Pengzhenrongella sicca TaxID=2819238 RepID=A0A8A4ZHH6_9MICO|nr:hypothetical protein [Pengzhenrongella sicca]QTE29967.1 hypothetical protein J4E96_02770 [Pengzhenrongella sicca]